MKYKELIYNNYDGLCNILITRSSIKIPSIIVSTREAYNAHIWIHDNVVMKNYFTHSDLSSQPIMSNSELLRIFGIDSQLNKNNSMNVYLMSREQMLETAKQKINNHFCTDYKTHNEIMADRVTSAAMIGFMQCWEAGHEKSDKYVAIKPINSINACADTTAVLKKLEALIESSVGIVMTNDLATEMYGMTNELMNITKNKNTSMEDLNSTDDIAYLKRMRDEALERFNDVINSGETEPVVSDKYHTLMRTQATLKLAEDALIVYRLTNSKK